VNQEGEGIPFIQGNAEFGALHPTPKNFCTEPSKICKPDDILISVRAPVGALNISDQKYVIGRGLSAITPESVRSGFCWYALQNSKYQLSVMETGTTFKAISGSDLANVFLPLPSQEEQRVIEGYLNFETSRIDRLITEKAGFIDLLKEKRQALISHVVTKGLDSDVAMKDSGVEWIGQVPKHWSIGKLKYFLNAIGDVDHYMPESIDDGIPYVMTGDLTELVSDIHFEHCKKVSERDYLKLSKKIKTSKGDVIMARYATIGTLSYVDIDKNFLVSYSCVTINPNHAQLLGLYLFYYLKSHTFLHGIQNHINTNTQGNVGINDLRKVEICVPSLQEQERIINFLSEKTLSIDTIIKETERSINLLKEHRTALISAAVTGKIDLRDKEVA
jgi:type I restriction enzyme S subunit